MTEKSTACSAREVLEDFNKSSVRVAWPRLADLLDVPPQMQHRIQRLHEYKFDTALLVKEEESLRQVLSYWENNDRNHTWETLSLALMSDPVYKDLGASLYFKHVKPEEFTLDKVYEEVKEITNPREIAYALIMDSKKLREIWGENADELTPEKRTKLAIDHWMTSHPLASWMLLAKHIERYIHGEHEAAAQKIATTIREKYLPKVEEKMEFGPPKDSEKRQFPEKCGANEAFKELTAVEDWFGLGWFLEIEEEELKKIEREHGRDDDRKLAMLKLWEELNPKSSWDSLTTAVRKMPQHQTLAEDIQEIFLEAERRRKLQENLKELYDQFFPSIINSLCDDQVYLSLIDQLTSRSLISEADKEERSIPTDQVPKARACSLLVALDIEKNPLVVIELMKAMEEIEELKLLAEKMKAHGQDYAKKDERQPGLIRHKKTEPEERLAKAKTEDYKEELKIVKEELDGKHKVVKVLTRQNEDLQQQVKQKNVHIIELQKRVITLEESTTSSVSDLDKLTTAVQTSISLPSSQLVGMQVIAEQVFEVQGGSAQPLLWEEHGFRMHIPQDALLPNETCFVFIKAAVAGLFQFPKGTEQVSAVYAISSTQKFHKPVTTELQHCVQLDSSEQGKYMSFAVARLDPYSTHYKFQLSEGTFQPNSYFGTSKENQFLSLATCIIKYSSTIKCPSNSGRQHIGKSEGDEQVEEAEKLEDTREPESKRPKLDIATPVDIKDVSDHKSILPGPTVYNAMTFYQKQNLPYTWIVAVAKKYNTMEEHVKKYFKDAEFDMKMMFSFEKEGKENGGSLLLVMEPHITPSGWLIQPQLHPCMIHERDVVLTDGSPECHPMFQKVEVTIADWSNLPTTTLAQSVPMLGIKYPNVTSLSFMFESPTTTGQLTGVKVVDEKIFKVKGESAQPLLWEEHSFRMYIPQDALLHNETCFVTVKAIVGGLFQFPEGTKPVSAVYAISLSKQLRKPARMEMQHCVKLKNPEDSKFMSFAIASQSPSSMPYQFQEVSDGIFEKNSFFGSVNRQQFSFMTIIWKLLGYNDAIQYIASSFIEKVEIGKQLWILAVSEDIDTMKRYLKSSLKKAKLEVEQLTFEFDKEKLTLKIVEKAVPGWIIEPLVDPCTITRKDVEHGPTLCKVRIAFEETTKPPKTAFRNRIRLDGAKPEHYFTIHLNQTELVQSDSDASNPYLRLLSSSSSMDSPLDNPATQSVFYMMVIKEIPAQWRMFGIMLDIEHGKLDGILRDERNCQDCFLVVYQIGKREFGERFTWRKILKILEDIGEKDLCKVLHEKLSTLESL